MIGETVSHYRIVSRLGGGGMGVVYEAEDPRLGRNVALKFLPDDTTHSPEALERFKREARASSALNHPHICTIHDIGEHEGQPFIVMERMKGQTLKRRIDGKRMPLEEVLTLGVQIADALDAAHGARIVHRDLKPANVFVTDHGEAKLLDFGLAKLVGADKEAALSSADTQGREDLTRPGLTLGTVAYMSPEQAHGDEVDARSDLFSLGVVLYEMSTGGLPFPGKTSAEIFNGILSHAPVPPSSLNPAIPPRLDEIILRALEKDRETRYQTAADLRADLKRLRRDSGSTMSGLQAASSVPTVRAIAAPPGPPWRWIAVAVAALALLVAAALLGRHTGEVKPYLATASFSQLTDQPGLEASPSLSPDGQSVVYASRISGNWNIYLQRVGGKKAIDLTADSSEDDTEPRFSPDGTLVAFRSERNGGGIFTMGATGESVRRVSTFGYSPAWSPDGKRLVCATERIDDPRHRWSTSTLWVVDVDSGAKRQLTTTDSVQPDWSPHGSRIAYWTMAASGQRDLWTIAADGGPPTAVTDDPALDWDPVWSRDGGYLFFSSDRGGSMNLWRVPLDEKTGTVGGAPEPVTTPSSDAGFMSFSGDGSMFAYVARAVSRNITRLPLDLDKEEAGAPEPVTKGSLSVRDLDVSPDGNWLAYNSESTEKLFVVRTDGTGLRQLTEGSSKDRGPRFSPDGSRIAFYSNRTGIYQAWTVRPDGSELQQVTESKVTDGLVFPVWSRDGGSLVASALEGGAFVVDVTKPWSQQTVAELPRMPGAASFVAWAWSPSGKWLSGWQLRPDASSSGVVIYDPKNRTYRTLTDFGTFPAWSSDERRIVFSGKRSRFVVDVRAGKLKELRKGDDFEEEFALSGDRRFLYTVATQREGDVWIASLSRPEPRR